MKRPFELFAAWRLTHPARRRARVPADLAAQQRWDGEGGNRGLSDERGPRKPSQELRKW